VLGSLPLPLQGDLVDRRVVLALASISQVSSGWSVTSKVAACT